jgi:signal transduction histidine kinase
VPDPRVRRLVPLGRRAEPVLAVALVAAPATEQLVQPGTEHSLWAVAAVIAFCATILARRDHPMIATYAASAVLVAVALIDGFSPAPIMFLVAPILAYSCGAHAPPRQGLLGIAALAVALQVQLGFADAPNVEIAVQTLPLWWAGLEVSRRRRLVDELARRTRELAAEEEAFVELSVRRERARIARDLHDIVSHHLAVMVIQAGAGRLAEPWQAAVAGERFATIRDAGVQALAETEHLVAVLQADEAGAPRLAQLLERTRATGAQVIVSPPDLALTPEIEAIAYRVVQEALTNAIKHAPGAAIEVHLGLRDGELTIMVRNETAAETSAIAHTGSGLGLAGMRERVEALGGSLAAGSDADGGFRLCARLPISRTHPRGGRRSVPTVTGDSPPSQVPSIVRHGAS